MAEINIGDKVRVKDRPDWVSPPGYRLANSEGTVVKISDCEDLLDEFQEYVKVQIDKTSADVKTGTTMLFRVENLEKI